MVYRTAANIEQINIEKRRGEEFWGEPPWLHLLDKLTGGSDCCKFHWIWTRTFGGEKSISGLTFIVFQGLDVSGSWTLKTVFKDFGFCLVIGYVGFTQDEYKKEVDW